MALIKIKIFITGISGMIGSHVAKYILSLPDEKYEVYGLVRYRSDLSNLSGFISRINLIYGDITDITRMCDILKDIQPSQIYHFAAQSINNISNGSPTLTLNVNINGTLNLLEAIRNAGIIKSVRILVAGSSTEYGKTADTYEGPIHEDLPLLPVSPYGVSKVACEMLARQYHFTYGLDIVVARYFIQIASGGTENLAVHNFCKQIAMIEKMILSPVLFHGNIDTLRDMTDMRDSSKVTVELMRCGKSGEAYNIGSNRAYSIRDILNIAVDYSTSSIELQYDESRVRMYDEKILLADISKVKQVTEWEPSPDISRTIHDILDYWRRRIANDYQTL